MGNAQLVLVSSFLLAGCADQPVAPESHTGRPSLQVNQGPVVHRVSAGGPDICGPDHPGCDGNYSLLALQMADGSVSGQWEDVWGPEGDVQDRKSVV